jgi:CBS domain-containing protein
MPNSAISEESFFFIHVESLCKGPAITCGPEMELVEMARVMKQHNISGLVVVDQGAPVGIVSIRDLRNIVADAAGDLAGRRVGEIMKTDLVTIRPRDYVFEAIFKMAKHNIHRLVVVDDEGRLTGVITDNDLLRIKTRTPLYLNQELEAAQSVEQLRAINARLLDMVRFAARAGADTRSLVQLISHFNDAFTLRVIALMERQEGIRLPDGVAYLVLGSEGRGEQTLRTDQDSAIVYADGLAPEKFGDIERFSARLVDALETIGVPRCPGDTMASNPRWRRSLSGWKQLLEQWISVPTPENMVNIGMVQDLRALHGDQALEGQLREHILTTIERHNLFLPWMARHIVHFQPPLGMFGRIRVERRGEHRGEVDLKKAGIFALTRGASLLALEIGILGGNTWHKLELLGERGVLSPNELETARDAFNYLVQLRLQRQLRDLAAGNKPSNHVNPLVMTDKERDLFRNALKGVGAFLRLIRDRYKLDFISR